MPTTSLELPILARFLCAVAMTTGLPAQPLDAEKPSSSQRERDATGAPLPPGVVLGPDGKP